MGKQPSLPQIQWGIQHTQWPRRLAAIASLHPPLPFTIAPSLALSPRESPHRLRLDLLVLLAQELLQLLLLLALQLAQALALPLGLLLALQ